MHVFVLDACSRDHTMQFARAAGAEVVQREWTDFIDARTYALEQVRTPWVLMLDADEALDDVLREAIVGANADADGYRVARTTYYAGKPMRLWRNELLVRLFRKDAARLVAHPAAGGTSPLHESWQCAGTVGTLAGTLLHFSYPDRAAYCAKYDRYTSIEAQGVRGSWLRLAALLLSGTLLRLPWLLIERGGLLDGPRGIYIAFKSAMYPAVVVWKALRV